MGLTSSLLIGRTALTASQVALQVTGNNIANAASPGYHRQRVGLTPLAGESLGQGIFAGRGVGVSEIRRLVDPALQARVRSSASDEQSAQVELSVLSTLESLTNELTGIDLSSEMSAFFNAFSELANNTTGTATRTAVIERGVSLAQYMRTLRSDLVEARQQIERELGVHVERADELLGEIASLNGSIVNSELGQGEEGSLRDQRDALIGELAELMDVTVIEQPSGSVDVLVDSSPLVQGTVTRGLDLDIQSGSEDLIVRVMTERKPEEITVSSGRIGGLLEQRATAMVSTIDDLDAVASQLIHQVNRLHTSGRPDGRLTDTTGWLTVPPADQALALNDPSNATFAELPFSVTNGSFEVTITDQSGNTSTTTVFVDLDGIDATGAVGFGDDTTMASLAADLDSIANLNAQITPGGQLRVFTDAGFDVSFGADSSGALSVLGIGTFFTGRDASDVGVKRLLQDDPRMLTVGAGPGTNETALAIAGLRERPLDELGGSTLPDVWLSTIERNAVKTSAAATRAEALGSVRRSLESQEAAMSGVSLDEESVNLITYQQQYQSAARFIAVTDELTQVLLGLV